MLFCNSGDIHLDYGDMRHKVYDEDFLVWIIPLTYLSHEAVNRACTTGIVPFDFIGTIGFYLFYDVFLL